MAIEMAETGNAPSLTIAAVMVGAAPITIMYCRKGRRNREEEGQRRQKLLPEEERAVIDRCYFSCRLGFPSTIWQLREIATSVVQKRNPHEELGKRWEEAFKKRHPELESIVQEYDIKAQNTYNLDEVGFLLGLGQSERVLEVIRNPHGT
ncbi:hypothetical protein B9Z19DRAFT_1069297 [Tuber borchii]|uniref:HTH CENPB-type domain-containing protein n=1 Tax=Tuber borchii TaxID=42251 RepID=A0A2T6ZC78_TUBBO|nr:hypothetical protein B9Z19DRAFT_1069297 [Tuber borchii]